MGGGLYSMEKRDIDKDLDMTKVKPYGDTMNDGKVQVSFTLPIEDGEKAIIAAKKLAQKMGLEDPSVAHHTSLDKGFTFFVIYGSLKHTIDYTKIQIESIEVKMMSKEEINDFIKENLLQKPLLKGNLILVDVMGTQMKFLVSNTKPGGIVLVDSKTKFLISEETADQLGDGVDCKEVGKVSVKGREEPVRLFAVQQDPASPRWYFTHASVLNRRSPI